MFGDRYDHLTLRCKRCRVYVSLPFEVDSVAALAVRSLASRFVELHVECCVEEENEDENPLEEPQADPQERREG